MSRARDVAAPAARRRRTVLAAACLCAAGLLAACQNVPLEPAGRVPIPTAPAARPVPAAPAAAKGAPAAHPSSPSAAAASTAPAPASAAAAAASAAPAVAASVGHVVRYEREDGALQPSIAEGDWLAAWPAWLASCRALTAARNARHGAWDGVCTESLFLVPSRGEEVRAFFSHAMDCYRVVALDASDTGGAPGAAAVAAAHDTGLMTGYYEPVLEGSRVRGEPFVVPIFRVPASGVTATRRELSTSGQLRGRELLWVRDPVEAFFLEVQGSGRIHLTDGSWIRVSYAGSNGQEYRSIGRWLADQGELPLAQVSQQAIRTWALAHPQRVREMLEQNPRVVFFHELPVGDPGTGPIGSLGVALTPGVSVAIDPRYLPLGAPLLLDTRAPLGDGALRRITVAQDTGGAIRGPLRVDWFWGLGPDAGELAGHQHAPGTVRLLVPRGVAPEALL